MLSPGRILPTVLSADRKKPRTRPLFHESKVLTFIMQDESHAPHAHFFVFERNQKTNAPPPNTKNPRPDRRGFEKKDC